ncbi:Uncharacterised protein [Mycobacterium tuberculosis]|uniref:Uncharacterized protein n=1 Tax=Mycobacterium tuberculosis TaxID=1773 RepID=A0A655IKW5_MYCTX|nr:Uncharacterised protein [Mycobacterium tuberculosis]
MCDSSVRTSSPLRPSGRRAASTSKKAAEATLIISLATRALRGSERSATNMTSTSLT